MAKLLGVDIGTTSLKMTLFDEKGTTLQCAIREYTLEVHGEIVEFDGEEYYRLFLSAYEEISANHTIDALSIDTQCETLLVADKEGNLLRKAIVWLDNRAVEEAGAIEAQFGRKMVYEVTGQAEVTATWPASKLLWLRQNEPEVFAKTEKVFLLADYLYFRICGEFVTEPTLQSSSLYMDIRQKTWWTDMLSFIGLDAQKLPEIRKSGSYIGKFRGTDVYMGVMDQVAGAIGAGVIRKGIVSEMTGTTMVVFAPADTMPPFETSSYMPCHVNYDGKYSLLMWTPTAGIALKWFRQNFAEEVSFQELDKMAEKIAPGCDGLTFLPYLCGSIMPRYAPTARGAFMGLTMEHTRAHAARSIMESVAFMLYENLARLGVPCKEVRSMGGGAASPLWCQMKADVIRIPLVTLSASETACLGSAILAGVGMGVYKTVQEACTAVVKTGKQYLPGDADYQTALQRFALYSERVLSDR